MLKVPMYEHRGRPLAPARVFLWRVAGHFGAASLVLLASLGVGMAGYHHYEKLSWLDAYLNAAMLLGGMGPVATPITSGGKLFAGLYALYSGVIFLVVVGVMLAPVAHRLLHKFHLEAGDDSSR